MVPLSTFSCGHDVMFLRRASSTADVVSDLSYWDCQGFSLIPVIHAHVSISGLKVSAIGVAFDNLKPFQRCRGGGSIRQTQVGWYPVIGKDHRLIGIHFFPCSCQKVNEKTYTAFITLAGAQKNISTCIRQVILPCSQSSFVLVGRTLGGTPSTPCRAPL